MYDAPLLCAASTVFYVCNSHVLLCILVVPFTHYAPYACLAHIRVLPTVHFKTIDA